VSLQLYIVFMKKGGGYIDADFQRQFTGIKQILPFANFLNVGICRRFRI